MKKRINGTIAVLSFLIVFLLCLRNHVQQDWIWILAAVIFGAVHGYWALRGEQEGAKRNFYISPNQSEQPPRTALTELVLLSEEDDVLATWNIYGKNGIVIGRDIGENQVTVDLNQTAYASMIAVEHAVLNYSGEDWYIEDISDHNGVSIQKQDGKKYKLSYGKPCKLERGDIIFITLARLQIL